MSQYTYQRNVVSNSWDLDTSIAADIETALPGKIFATYCNNASMVIKFTIDLTPEEEADLNSLVEVYRSNAPIRILADIKIKKACLIDERTKELIDLGFLFQSKQFSLSFAAQGRLTGINQVRDNPNVIYPVRWNTLDDSDTIDIPDASTILAFYLTAMGTYRAHVDSGTALKDLVRAATTVAEVNAIIDPR